MNESRKQFEEWVTKDSLNKESVLAEFNDGRYSVRSTQKKWEGWQASRQALEGNS